MRMYRKGFAVLVALTMFFTSSVNFAYASSNQSPFTESVKQEFYTFLNWAHENDYFEYNRFALHDIDGDNIPEILMGETEPWDSRYVSYAVIKYNKGDFQKIGVTTPSRYLMKDRYSNAILALYYRIEKGISDVTEICNYYVHNATLQRNTLLKSTGSTYLKNNQTITRDEYYWSDLYNYLGTYDELIVHDSFNTSVILTAIYTWKPISLGSPYLPRMTRNDVVINKSWQLAYKDFIGTMTGPADTYVDPYDIWFMRANTKYTRFALHDLTSDGVPELLIGVNHGTQVSYDVYRYIRGEVVFAGSFDSYSKYIAKFPNSNDIFAYDPSWDMLNFQTVSRTTYKDNRLQLTKLMSAYASVKNPSVVTYDINDKITTYAKYHTQLISYINTCTEIKTYDISIVPSEVVLRNWRPLK